MPKILAAFSSIALFLLAAIFIFLFQEEPLKAADIKTSGNQSKKVGIQAGHWKNSELPEELAKLRGNDGAQWASKKEVEINLKIAQLVVERLKEEGVDAELLPATIPPGYNAQLFLSVHADQHPSVDYSGFKIAASSFDQSGYAHRLANHLEEEYQIATQMNKDPHLTAGMTRYYAFNFLKFAHSINPQTPAALIETGFLPNRDDQKILLDHPEKAARGIVNGIKKFLKS